MIARGRGFVVVRWRGIDIASCYISPNVAVADSDKILLYLQRVLRQRRGRSILVGGISMPNPPDGGVLRLTREGTQSRSGPTNSIFAQ